MRRGWIGVGVALAAYVPLAACGDAFSDGVADGGSADVTIPTPGDAMPDNAALDSDVPDNTIGADTGTLVDGGGGADATAFDAPQDHFVQPDTFVPPTDACTAEIASDATAVFVATNGAGSTCSKANPCASINAALSAAKASGKRYVYIEKGTYTEQVTLIANVTVQGGWTRLPEWTRDCSPTAYQGVVIQGLASSNITVDAPDVGGVVLDTLTVTSRQSPAAATSESIIGVFARGANTTLTLNNVAVSVIAAGSGANGSPGGPAAVVVGTCPIGSAMNGATGTDGTAGGGATAGLPGRFTSLGYNPPSGGAAGQATAGSNGVYTPATCSDTVAGCTIPPDFLCDPAPGPKACGADGAPGCAGAAGSSGTPGAGGGSSTALYVYDARVTVNGGSLQAGNGGAGGTGGGGGSAGTGSSGATGASRSVAASCGAAALCQNVQVKGGKGASGGNGGAGGAAGGGAGGYSLGYFVGGAGTVSASAPLYVHGTGGTGGTGGAGASNKGADGVGADHN